jgi:hypothetical protein
MWDNERRTVSCLDCHEGPQSLVSPGVAGASARAEAARRRTRQAEERQSDIEARPVLGRVKHALNPKADAGKSWATGAMGEERLGAALDTKVPAEMLKLHDRRVPPSRANIDHLVVAATGVWVIDAKRYRGRLARVNKGGWRRPDLRVTIAGHDQTKLIDGVARQVAHVRKALGDDFGELPIHGVLCFIDTEWGWLTKPFFLKGMLLTYPKPLYARLAASGPVDTETRQTIHRRLASSFPPA